MVNGVIAVTVGLPGSGKTTFCQSLNNSEEVSSEWHIIHVCYDEIINDRNNWQLPDFQWRTERTNVKVCVETLISRILQKPVENCAHDEIEEFPETMYNCTFASWETVKDNFVVLVDDNMYYRSMRYVYYQLARKYRLGFVQLNFDCSLEIALNRNCHRLKSERVPETVIRRMFERLEKFDSVKNDWEKRTFVISATSDVNSSYFLEFQKILKEASNDPPPFIPDDAAANEEKQQSKLVNKENNLHQADLILRKLIGKIRKFYLDQKLDDVNEICSKIGRSKNNLLSKMRSNILDSSLARNPIELERLFLDLNDLSHITFYDS